MVTDHPPDTDALLKDLTPPQREAVLCTEGPLLVLAAAGSGKTRVITRRIAHLVSMGVPAYSILALTFTNKAAGEMRERVHALLGDGRSARGLTVTTFHSLCARLLRRYAEAAGLKPDFSIYDSGDQAALCKQAIEALQLSTSNFPPRSVLSAISNAKNKLEDADAFERTVHDFTGRNIARIYKSYTQALRRANAVDFDDLLLLTARLLERDASARGECQSRWRYLLVDEYQDTNHAQFLIASLLAGSQGSPKGPNFCVVGDPDQAIYGWRGADIGNILEFEQHYPGARVIMLGENFRSTAPILTVADTLIRNNKLRKHKDLFTSRQGGEKPRAVLCTDEHHEARVVVEWFRNLQLNEEVPWREMAVFYRTNSLSRVIEDSLRKENIPYTVARGTAFYDREEVKNALAYLRVVANSADGVSLARIINTPSRGISDATVDKAEVLSARTGQTLLESLRHADQIPGLNPRALASIAKFITSYDGWTGGGKFLYSGVNEGMGLADLVNRIIVESGLEAMYKAQAAASQSETDVERTENLAELVSSAREFELKFDAAADPAGDPLTPLDSSQPQILAMLRAYLESVALVADADSVDPAQGSVTLMTLHAAKGLEFRAVAMLGLEEGLLPHSRSIGLGGTDAQLEEERRLCFVGITRAMRSLLITSAKYRTIRGASERTIPSRFLSEVPESMLTIEDAASGWHTGDDWAGDDASAFRPPALGQARPGPAVSGMAAQFPAGSKVRHPQFGIGTIKSVMGGQNARAVIDFRDVGTKTLVLEYARLTRVT
jgi:DNA helicase-2/ATP-dependent DNA helicase PcrA